MSDAGDGKGKRGLFRRARPSTSPGTTPATGSPGPRGSVPKRSGDMFARRGKEDAWSSSAWDDDGWDDDFSDRSRRSSIRPAADPKPEAVDAWLTSNKDEFDDVTRDITVKWSGKEPAAAQALSVGATWDDPIATDSIEPDPIDIEPTDEHPRVDNEPTDEHPHVDVVQGEYHAEQAIIGIFDARESEVETPVDRSAIDNGFMEWDEAAPIAVSADDAVEPSFEASDPSSPTPAVEGQLPFEEIAPDEPSFEAGVVDPPALSPLLSTPVHGFGEAPPKTTVERVGPDGERDLFLEDLYAELDDVVPVPFSRSAAALSVDQPIVASPEFQEPVASSDPVERSAFAAPTPPVVTYPVESDVDTDDIGSEPIVQVDTVTTRAAVDTSNDTHDDDSTQLLDFTDIPVARNTSNTDTSNTDTSNTDTSNTDESAELPEFAPDVSFVPRPPVRVNDDSVPTHQTDSDCEIHDESFDREPAHAETQTETHDMDDTFPVLNTRRSFVHSLDDEHDLIEADSYDQDSYDQDSYDTAETGNDGNPYEDRAGVEPQAEYATALLSDASRPFGSLASPDPESAFAAEPHSSLAAAPVARIVRDGIGTPDLHSAQAPTRGSAVTSATASTRTLTSAGLGLIAVESLRMLGEVGSSLSVNAADRIGSLDAGHRIGQVFADLGVTHGAILAVGVGFLALPQLFHGRLSDKAATKTGLGLGLALIGSILGVIGGILALRWGVRVNDAAGVDDNFGTIARYVGNVVATTGSSLVAMIIAFRTLDLGEPGA